MIHHGKGLPLRLEPRHDLRRVHAGFDDLQRNLAADRVRLLSEPDFAHAAFAHALQQAIGPDEGDCARCRRLHLSDVIEARHVAVWQIGHFA